MFMCTIMIMFATVMSLMGTKPYGYVCACVISTRFVSCIYVSACDCLCASASVYLSLCLFLVQACRFFCLSASRVNPILPGLFLSL